MKSATSYGNRKACSLGPQCYKYKGYGHFRSDLSSKRKEDNACFQLNIEAVPESSTGDQETVAGKIEEYIMLTSQAAPTTQLESGWWTNIFHTRVAYIVIIDNGSALNVVSAEAVEKLYLWKEHPI